MKILELIFSKAVYIPFSFIISLILRSKGIRVGKGFYTEGVPKIKIRGHARNIVIGNNVKIYGGIDIRNREQGQIIIEDNVSFDTNCRLVAANNAKLIIKSGVEVGLFCVFNCGEDVVVGKDTLFGGFCYIQSSNHGVKKGKLIKFQKHTYGKISIGAGAWIGSHVTILPNVIINDGAVVSAKALVNKDVGMDEIVGGVPVQKIAVRT